MVLVHPLAADLRFWDAQAAVLSEAFQVLRLDLPGHGRSAWTGGELSLDDLAHCVLGAIDRIGVDQVHYCGLSIGGMVGMELALRHPKRVSSLALSKFLAHLGQTQLWEERAQEALAGKLRDLVGLSVPRWVTPAYLRQQPEAAARLLATAACTDPHAYAAFCRLLGSIDLRGEVARIAVPTLVIAGSLDIATPAPACEALAAAMPHAQFVTLDSAHFSNLECPASYSETLLRFFQGSCA